MGPNAGIPIQAGSTLVGLAGSIMGGNAAADSGEAAAAQQEYEAALLRQQAGAARADSQRASQNESLKTTYALSAGRAAAAASGVSTSGTTPVAILSRVARQGEYDRLAVLASGEERARGLEDQANLDVWQAGNDIAAGKKKQTAMLLDGSSTALGSFGSMAAKYGNAGFVPNTTASAYPTSDYGAGGSTLM